jgi:heavy metal translocating P-type ATPase
MHDHDHHGHSHAGHSHSHGHSHDHGRGPAHSRVDPNKPVVDASASRYEKTQMECCSHDTELIERNIILCLVGGVLVLATAIGKYILGYDRQIAEIPAAIGAVLLAFPLLVAAWREVKVARLGTSTLTAMAILGALAVGEYVGAGLLAFVLLVFAQFIRRHASGAQAAIEALVKLTPDTARLLVEGVEREVRVSELKLGSMVRVRPGENLPVDGQIVSGRSTLNQASLTGESAPVEKAVGDQVYAGTTNLTGALDVRVTQLGGETTIGKVTQLIRTAEQSRTPRQLLIEQVAQFFVPVAIAVAGIVWFIKSQSPDAAVRDQAAITAVTVLVVTCPAALLLASPSAMLAAFAAAARLGILVKQPSYLEAAGNINTVVMDKTGTITTGKFQVTKLAPAPGVEGTELLTAAANAEQHSNHPLAQSILTTARRANVTLDGSNDYEEIHGRGVRARTSMGELHVGRASWLREISPRAGEEIATVESRIEGMSGVHVMRDGRYLGAVGLEDTVRPNTRGVVQRLRELGVRQIAIFTGDRLSVAKRVGANVGVDLVEAECLPEEKHEQVQGMVKSGRRVMMVGDGINDGPSLAAADVGVAMGLSGSDIAANSAGVALMNDDLSRVPFLMELSRRTRTIVAQNIAASIVIVLVGLVLAASGVLTKTGAAGGVVLAGLYHFVGEIFVLGNSFRLFRFGEEFIQAEKPDEGPKRRAQSVRLGAAAQPA